MNKYVKSMLATLVVMPSTVFAANYGTDLNNTMLPATGGMGGASVARTVEGAAAVFGNPATLTEYNEGTTVAFGATYYRNDVRVRHDGSITGQAWSSRSNTDQYLVPTVAITQAFSPRLVAGIGLTAQSGLGSDFRDVPGSLDPNSELLIFSANAGLGYKVTDNLSLGAMATLGNGFLQMSLNSASGSTHGFGFRGTAGAKYDVGATSLGAYYRSPLKIEYERFIDNGAPIGPGKGNFWSVDVEQPQEFAVGIANNSLMGGNLLISADIIYKDWSSADLYKDFYRDQTVYALGAQLTTGAAKWRIGYSYARDPIKRNVGSSIGGVPSFAYNGATVNLSPPLTQYFQATNAEAIWEHQLSGGFGYQLTKTIAFDSHAAVALENSDNIGDFTHVKAKTWQVGAGLTWKF